MPEPDFENASLEVQGKHLTLAEELAEIRDHIATSDPAFAKDVDLFIAHLAKVEAGASAPQVGQRLEPFLLPDDRGGLYQLSDFTVRGPVIISFLRGHWCPYCAATKAAHDRVASKASDHGISVVTISPEPHRTFGSSKAEKSVTFLTDVDNGYALTLRLMIATTDRMADAIRGFGLDVSRYQIGGSWFIPIPATFLVGQDGVIVDRYVDYDYRFRVPIEDFFERAKVLATKS